MAEPERTGTPPLRVLDGDSCADWTAAYADNAEVVYRLVYRQVGNRPDAEDLTEEVFLAALPRLRLPAPSRSVRAYLAATVRTVVADHWRRHYAAPPTTAIDDGVAASGPEPTGDEARGRALSVLSRLPERFRRILELRFLHGLSVRQAAAEMGVTAGNARVIQHRALRLAAGLTDPSEETAE
jgi:RNA polymerase sigma factor (sigma-70 family)